MEKIVVSSSAFVFEMALDDWKDGASFLPPEEWFAKMTEEFAARFFKQIQIASVIDVIAERAFGVSDAVRMMEDVRRVQTTLDERFWRFDN